MRHKILHTKYGYWLTPLALSLLLTGCTQYNFADSLRTTDTIIQTETVTNTVTKNTTQSDSDSSSEDSSDKEPEIEHNVESAPADSNENSGQISNPGNNTYIPDTPKTANSLDYPDGGYKTVTDTYIKAVMDTINTMRLNSGLSSVSQSSTYADDANIYAARMAAENRFIGQNTNNSASLATCMTSWIADLCMNLCICDFTLAFLMSSLLSFIAENNHENIVKIVFNQFVKIL